MPLEGEKLDELLSGFLDGQLNDEELKLVEEELRCREEVRRRLDDLSGLRQDLKQLYLSMGEEAGRKGLRSDFATRVIAEAQREAAQAGLPAEHHVRLAESGMASDFAPGSQVVRHDTMAWGKVVAAISVLAAAVLIVVYLPGFLGQQPAVDPLVNNPPSPAPEPLVPDAPEVVHVDENLPPENLLPKNPPTEPSSPRYVSEIDFKKEVVFVVDIELSQEAIREDRLRRVLRKNGVLNEVPIVADKAVEKAIEDTSVIVPTGNGEQEAKEDDEAIIYFMRADHMLIGAALDEIYFDRESFPSVSFNFAIDNPMTRLMGTIARSTGTRFSLNQSFAVPVTVDAEASQGSPFSGLKKPARMVSVTARERGFSGSGMADATQLTTVLIIVRTSGN